MATMLITTKGADLSIRSIVKELNTMTDSLIEDKFDVRKEVSLLVTYMDINECDNIIYFEQSKRNLRLWIADAKNTFRFTVLNYASVFDMSTVYNYHKDSGHVLLFTADFDENEHLKMFKNIAEVAFKCKENASVERALCFFNVDGRICIRSYLIEGCHEIGPRIDIELDRIFDGCFKGQRIYSKEQDMDSNKE